MERNIRITDENENYLYYKVCVNIFAPDNEQEIGFLKKRLLKAIRNELSEKQFKYMRKYYWNGWSMEAIAREYGVNKSTVSITIRRGRDRLKRVLKYVNPKYIPSS